MLAGGFISFIVGDPDPANHGHLLVAPHTACGGGAPAGCLAETFDGGDTWRVIRAPGAAEAVGPIVVDSHTFLFTGDLQLTRDSGEHWTDVAGSIGVYGGGFVITRTSDGTYVIPQMQGVLTSPDLENWTGIPLGRTVSFAAGNGQLFTGDAWSLTFWTAQESDPARWSPMPSPSDLSDTTYGAAFLAYDAGHHVLYVSGFAGGLHRIVTP
jgi:photosystem II stability/assembly factor-like uncharacterized protein